MRFPRTSGVLLHISSLPSQFGIGDLGPGATQFIDFLESSGQKLWQVLPLGPPARGDSPYSCYSAFAGNPSLISPEQLVEDGWLSREDISLGERSAESGTKVDFRAAEQLKQQLLEKAFANAKSGLSEDSRFVQFQNDNAFWLIDFSRFQALLKHFDNPDWTQWPERLVRRDPEELEQWDSTLADDILFSQFSQFLFDQQWKRVKQLANDRGIRIFGDMPIFVAHESADVWANQSLFFLDADGKQTVVAGVPPDYFSETGQRWGNPLYRWDVCESQGYSWWVERFRFAFRHFDLLRVDHFRGFESYWEIPATAETAIDGQWRKGPGSGPFDAAREKLGELAIVAEDLGLITDEVHELRDQLQFPPMRILQFGFEQENDVFHRPGHYPEHSVAYTGTHDNDTLMGWYTQRSEEKPDNQLLDPFLQGDGEIHQQLIKAVLGSESDTVVIPMQDLLGLGNEARMNLPGEPDGNWAWRVQADAFSEELSQWLANETSDTNR